ncbi:unnamed protein product [Hermetia illucens]|uniref:Fatty acyl-CoA reductase n=1 Tax=Hermetia illucens TaxID=343691 RepID=A0A7R8Z220_HERIL|nr:fatty acyl-CoA reductase wat [Hermetia illucens]XP_037926117.1 fatty acyl-CoA reductase wat [Hermetia illucens]CAD7094220.1 unnamed protein product [Hermetia illucens]
MNATKIEDVIKDETPMQEFYRKKCVFLTGGTGFFGKIIIEKLIRVTDIEHIYILIRNKKGKDVYTRLEEMFDDPVFDTVKRLKPKFQHKISVIKGDCLLPGLGISPEERILLQQNIDVVFHAAATVRFDEKLKIALGINVCGTREIIGLCRELVKLKAIVHVSTAFANCNHSFIEEKFYKVNLSGENACCLADCLDDRTLDNITHELIRDYPNTYTYTKSLAEDLVRSSAKGLPIVIFRPGIVIPTYKEPIPGWIDNMYGPSGIIVGVGTGILRVFHGRVDNAAHVVPVDMSINALLAAAWDVSMKTYDEPPIYNYIPDVENSVSWKTYIKVGYEIGSRLPILRSIWHPNLTITSSKLMFNLLCFLYHTLPGFLMDLGLVAIGRKPRMMQIYRKVHKFCAVMSYFSNGIWRFSNNNTRRLYDRLTKEDQQLFSFDMRTVHWETLVEDSIRGLRTFVVKEDPNNVENAIKRYKRLKLLHYSLIYGIYTLAVFLLYTILSKLF